MKCREVESQERVKGVSEIPIVQAVFDEAGDTGQSARSSRYLVVAGIVCNSLQSLRRVVARTRKTLGKKLREIPELKAWHTPANVIVKMLNRLALLDIEVYAAILDKHSARPPQDREDWYRQVYCECVRLVVAHHPRMIMTMDRRYTKATLQDELVRSIVTSVERPGTTLLFIMANSQREKALQAADAVAWSIFQQYAHEDREFYSLIEGKIIGEVLLLR